MATIIKVRVWGKYRKAQVLAVGEKAVRVRLLAYELCQGLSDRHTVGIRQVRKADLPVLEALRQAKKAKES